jgi:hypothetical protein
MDPRNEISSTVMDEPCHDDFFLSFHTYLEAAEELTEGHPPTINRTCYGTSTTKTRVLRLKLEVKSSQQSNTLISSILKR